MDHTNTQGPAAAAITFAGEHAQTTPRTALKTHHFQWSGCSMMQKENIGCTGSVSPLQLPVTYIYNAGD